MKAHILRVKSEFLNIRLSPETANEQTLLEILVEQGEVRRSEVNHNEPYQIEALVKVDIPRGQKRL